MSDVSKEKMEDILHVQITDEQFQEALKFAKHKQNYIYKKENREVVKQPWYLLELVKEYVANLAFSRATMRLCRICNMEKEHLLQEARYSTDNHIVTPQEQ